MDAPDVRTAREILQAALAAAGMTLSDADVDRLASGVRDFLSDGRRLAGAVSIETEPLPVVNAEE